MLKLTHAFSIACFSSLLAVPATAQERLLAEYVADIGPEDHRNSSGQRLTSFAALLAQDRANYHRFGIRHRNDGDDPIFSRREMRAQISPSVVQIKDYHRQYVENLIALGENSGTYMVVSVYGTENRISRITFVVPG